MPPEAITQREGVTLCDIQTLLHDTNDNFLLLTSLFEKLQLATYEASDMMLDLMTFVSSVRYFTAIVVDSHKTYSFHKSQPWTDYFDPSKLEEMDGYFSSRSSKDSIRKEYFTGRNVIGVAYLTMPPESRNSADGVNDLNVGILIQPEHRRKGYASKAMQLILDHAFKTVRCHRAQAIIMDPFTQPKYPAYRFFSSIGFRQEGIRRRSYFNPFHNEYQDMAYMAILDTEWLTAQRGSTGTRMTPWDELLHRHDLERAVIMRWEEKMGDGMDETQTLREPSAPASDAETETETEEERASSPDFYIDSSESDSNWELLDDDSANESEHL